MGELKLSKKIAMVLNNGGYGEARDATLTDKVNFALKGKSVKDGLLVDEKLTLFKNKSIFQGQDRSVTTQKHVEAIHNALKNSGYIKRTDFGYTRDAVFVKKYEYVHLCEGKKVTVVTEQDSLKGSSSVYLEAR